MGIFWMASFFRYCLFGLLSFSVLTAEAARTVIVQPSELLPTYGPGVSPNAFIDSRNWNATVSDQSGARHSVPVVRQKGYTFPTFRNALKNGLKLNPGQLVASGVLAGALAAVDWVMSPDNTQLQKGSSTILGYPATSIGLVDWWPQGICEYRTPDQTINKSTLINYQGTQYSVIVLQATSSPPAGYAGPANCTQTWNGYTHIAGQWPRAYWAPFEGSVPSTYEPLVDSDYDPFVSGFTDPSQAADIAPHILDSVPGSFDYPDSETFTGPSSIDLPGTTTTTTNPTTGDTTVVENIPSLQLEYANSPLSITSTETNITNTYENGTQTSTSTTTETNTNIDSPPSEVPTDCDFMPTVCSFIDWVKTPFNDPDPDLSGILADEDFTKNIDFASNATCPSPSVIDTTFGSFNLSWEPGCQWAGMIKPFILMAALLSAIFIAMGAVRGGD
jgi:hypothetical protein